jgi:methylmalonyl-CoA/ethylmalonyl-CoA epimerase
VEVRSVHHVAFAVDDLEAAVATYGRLFGAEVELRGRLDDQGVEAVYLRVGSDRLELLAALAADTPVGRFLAKRGPGMHHVAFEVTDVSAAIHHLSARGATMIDEEPRAGLAGQEVTFVHPDSLHGVLAEVLSPHG